MKNWKITTLFYGYTNGETPGGQICSIPWLGFYLTNGESKILCDTGVKRGFFKDSKSPWGYYAEGDETHVLKALDGIGVKPESIDLVIYTHFHWDHAGNSFLFTNAVHIFQDKEWKELIDPLPSMDFYGVYDQRVCEDLKKMDCQRISGDLSLMEGLDLIHTPGHSAGHQSLRVVTAEGVYILAGDLFCVYHMAWPEQTDWKDLDGNSIVLDSDMKKFIVSVFTSPVFDHYAWYRSQYRVKGMIRDYSKLIPGHEPSIVSKTFG